MDEKSERNLLIYIVAMFILNICVILILPEFIIASLGISVIGGIVYAVLLHYVDNR